MKLACFLLNGDTTMKTRLLVLSLVAVSAVTQVLAVEPGDPVPESSSMLGLLGLGVAALLVVRRKLTK